MAEFRINEHSVANKRGILRGNRAYPSRNKARSLSREIEILYKKAQIYA